MSVKRLVYFYSEDEKAKEKNITISDDPDETISHLANLVGMDDETVIASVVKDNTGKKERRTLDDDNES